MKKGERNETREEKHTNDWSIRAPEWYQAQPIGTVHHLRDPIHRSGSGRRTKPSREDREILIDPLSLFSYPFLFLSANVVCKRWSMADAKRSTNYLRATWNLESALHSRSTDL